MGRFGVGTQGNCVLTERMEAPTNTRGKAKSEVAGHYIGASDVQIWRNDRQRADRYRNHNMGNWLDASEMRQIRGFLEREREREREHHRNGSNNHGGWSRSKRKGKNTGSPTNRGGALCSSSNRRRTIEALVVEGCRPSIRVYSIVDFVLNFSTHWCCVSLLQMGIEIFTGHRAAPA
ncbi:hypothetical protein Salat_1694700 [Sesamum alatum]|uniref:Uncharacterized protein n=1 Tax=Sesamum alatum TaxID=300844 RepID=A0AAE1Y878_9LAMI|nr:hypothetical protein Salat_1694700 [Sesamum alatum]